MRALPHLFLLPVLALLWGCAPASTAEAGLVAAAQQATAPPLLTRDALTGWTGGDGEAAGAALAAKAAALRAAAAGL